MNLSSKPVVGQTVWYLKAASRSSDASLPLHEYEVVSVGRKYFAAAPKKSPLSGWGKWTHREFSLIDGREKADFQGGTIYLDAADYHAKQERETLHKTLARTFEHWVPVSYLTLEDYRALDAIIKAAKERT